MHFNELVITNDILTLYLKHNHEVVPVNYSKENKNEEELLSLGFPKRFGFPVSVVLDGKGNRIHTQNSAYLQEGKGHSTEKVLEFLESWLPIALDPGSYQE